jgi:hypothetical protein
VIRPRFLEQRSRSRIDAVPAGDRAEAVAETDAWVIAAEWLIPAFAGLSVAIWLVLMRWYDVHERYATPYFAFEKLPGQFNSPILRKTLSLFVASSLLYAGGCVLLARVPRVTRTIKLGALAFIAGPAVVNIWIFPVGALDVFNYMVDLKLAFHYHDNPYVVTNPGWLLHDPITKSAFLLNVPLFYGPAWLVFSGIPAIFTGFDDVVRLLIGLKVLNLALLGVTAWLIARAQPTPRRRWLAPFVFLANPLVVFEGIGNAHNDVMMTVLLVAALVSIRQRRTGWLAAPALALSGLVKIFSFVAAPLFLVETLKRHWRPRAYLLAAVVAVAIGAGVTLPFWDGGDGWTGFREGTRLGQRMDHVSPLSLAQQRLKEEIAGQSAALHYLSQYSSADVVPQSEQDHLHREFTVAFAALALLVLAARVANLLTLERATALTMMLFALLMTNLYPWYLIPIVALLAMELEALGLAYVFAGTLLGLAYYPAYVWAHFNTTKSLYQVHIFLAIFLTAPLVAFLLIEILRLLYGANAALQRRSHKLQAASTKELDGFPVEAQSS